MRSLSTTEQTADGREARFPLSRNTPDTRAFARCMFTFGAVMAVVCVVLFASGVGDASQATSGAVTVLVICGGLPLCFGLARRWGHGEVRINGDGISLAAKLNVAEYPWHDIAAIRIASTRPTGLYGLMIRATRSADKDRTIELTLGKPHSIGLRSGTASPGISTGLRLVRLHVDDPERLLAVAQTYAAA